MEQRALHSFNDLIEIKFCQNKDWCCLIDSGHRLADLSGPVSSTVLPFAEEIANSPGSFWEFLWKMFPLYIWAQTGRLQATLQLHFLEQSCLICSYPSSSPSFLSKQLTIQRNKRLCLFPSSSISLMSREMHLHRDRYASLKLPDVFFCSSSVNA